MCVVRIAAVSSADAIARSAGGVLAGAALGELAVRGARRLPAEWHVALPAAGLAGAAAIYPGGHDEGSRMPRWYPALCAGDDLAVCGHLARRLSDTAVSLRHAAVATGQRIVAAEVATASGDHGRLEPVLGAALRDFARPGSTVSR